MLYIFEKLKNNYFKLFIDLENKPFKKYLLSIKLYYRWIIKGNILKNNKNNILRSNVIIGFIEFCIPFHKNKEYTCENEKPLKMQRTLKSEHKCSL